MANKQIPRRYYRFAEIALKLAKENRNGATFQLCCLVVKKNQVLAIGYNSSKTHPIADTKMQQLHAEMDAAIRATREDLEGADLIVARYKPSQAAGMAKPCEACEALIRRLPVRRVYYTVSGDTLTLVKL